jgi:hypothetical protein
VLHAKVGTVPQRSCQPDHLMHIINDTMTHGNKQGEVSNAKVARTAARGVFLLFLYWRSVHPPRRASRIQRELEETSVVRHWCSSVCGAASSDTTL